jgi:hypothetical protein
LSALRTQLDLARTADQQALKAHEAALGHARAEAERWRTQFEALGGQVAAGQGEQVARLQAVEAELAAARQHLGSQNERLAQAEGQREQAAKEAARLRAKLALAEGELHAQVEAEAIRKSQAAELQTLRAGAAKVAHAVATERRLAEVTAELAAARAAVGTLESLRVDAADAASTGARVAALEHEVAELSQARDEAERRSLAERDRARVLEGQLQSARPPEDVDLQLKAGHLREEALKQERERLHATLREAQDLQRETESERLRLAEKIAATDSVRAALAAAEGSLGATEIDLLQTRAEVVELKKKVAAEEGHRAEHLAKATAKAGVEAKMYRDLADRQSGELKELRVQWAKASAEINRLKAGQEALQASEAAARAESEALKGGKGVLSAADLADAMGVDLNHVARLEQRIQELEAVLAKGPTK